MTDAIDVRAGDWCARLADAIVDGRISEDPALWRPHYRGCPRCLEAVEGYLLVRALLRESSPEDGQPAPPPVDPTALWRATYEGYRRRRRARLGWAVAAVALLGVGTVGTLALRSPPPRAAGALESRDAAGLLALLRGAPGQLHVERLTQDPALEATFRAALDAPDPSLRSVAACVLALSGLPLEAPHLERLLVDAVGHLDRPLVVAASGSLAWQVAEALEQGRTRVLQRTLGSVIALSGRSTAPVPWNVLAPYVRDAEPTVRELALVALALDPHYRPEPVVLELLDHDPAPDVRAAAGRLLARRGGPAGAAALLDRMEAGTAPGWEAEVAASLPLDERLTALAHRRVGDEAVSPLLALTYAGVLHAAGEPFDHGPLARRALASPDPDTWQALAAEAARGGWHELRADLQLRWESTTAVDRQRLGAVLARWDADQGSPDRVELALRILEDGPNPFARGALATLASHGDAAVVARVEAIRRAWAAPR